MANTSAIFFKIRELVTDAGTALVRAEEITLVLLVLVLWGVAILLFFHRWGKIRMLEPYQPEYKPLNHSPACPLAPTTPTLAAPRPPNLRPLLPRKSSSLCFTPSMLRTGKSEDQSTYIVAGKNELTYVVVGKDQSTYVVAGKDQSAHDMEGKNQSTHVMADKTQSTHVMVHVPPACRISVPQIDQTPIHRCSRPAHQSPATHARHSRHRLRLASDSLDHSTYCQPQSQVDVSRKVRSAENLRHYRITSRGYSEEIAGSRGASCYHSESVNIHHHPLTRRRSCQSQSLDLENYRSATPLLQDGVPRGRSLDSTSVSSLRRSPTAGPSWAGGDPFCTTPELRVSPTPPETTSHHSHPHAIALQRQETVDDALLPVPYATLMEEELENEV
ncbi:uncharacterized protein LOC121868822 isoform X1 [Homarus americanus]|uniref:uncharacterized protein LOC121868822 isoform X1 n=1 Tax=Homarus americanus TaxID=6706 RepID=UPI001C4846B2|nr:uncharacterized protein LOC121868822 isoform X1 [Homarus americanus]